MACFQLCNPDDDDKNEDVEYENSKNNRTMTIVLLGPGGCGKTTILKQMKKINKSYDENDSKMMSSFIKDSVIGYMKTLCQQSVILNTEYKLKGTLVNNAFEQLRKECVALQAPYSFNADVIHNIKTLWMDHGIQETLKNRSFFQIGDNSAYFFDRIDVISSDDYVPSYEDDLRITTITAGFTKTKLVANKIKNNLQCLVYDVGGIRSERRKWMKILKEEIDCVLFVVPISEYDLKLFEDNQTNRLIETINLFHKIFVQDDFYKNKQILLLFNKFDLFQKKIKTVPITVAFPDFPKNEMNPNDENDSIRYIAGKFVQVFEQQNISLDEPLRIVRTNALDTNTINKVFRDITIDFVKKINEINDPDIDAEFEEKKEKKMDKINEDEEMSLNKNNDTPL